MGILFDDLNTHVDNPEALVVGVVSDCPAELLLGVQQPVGTPRSGICKVNKVARKKNRFKYDLLYLRLPIKLRPIKPKMTPLSPCSRGLHTKVKPISKA